MKTDRLEYFSDAVFAIVITLLIIDVHLPTGWTGDLPGELLSLWPSYLAYAVSFFVIGAIWINHHGMFQHIVRADNSFLLLNILQLMAIAFLPFPTAVLAEAIHVHDGMTTAIAFYGCTLVAVGIAVNLMWRYAVSHALIRSGVGEAKVKLLTRRFLIGPLAYAVAVLVGLAVPWAALAILVGINIYFLWPRWKRKQT